MDIAASVITASILRRATYLRITTELLSDLGCRHMLLTKYIPLCAHGRQGAIRVGCARPEARDCIFFAISPKRRPRHECDERRRQVKRPQSQRPHGASSA